MIQTERGGLNRKGRASITLAGYQFTTCSQIWTQIGTIKMHSWVNKSFLVVKEQEEGEGGFINFLLQIGGGGVHSTC